MDYILTGEKRYVEQVLQMTSHLARRGDIKFIPVSTEHVGILVADDKYVKPQHSDCKEPPMADEKKPRKRTTKKAE